MKLQQVRLLWKQLNLDYFGGKLKEIPLLITRARSYWGKYVYHEATKSTSIHLSGYKNWTLKEYYDSLLHEMVHQYLRECLGDPREDDHGPIFEREATKRGLKAPWDQD